MSIPVHLLPKDPRHQRFADLRLSGVTLTDAYHQAFDGCTRRSAAANARRTLDRPDVQAYVNAVRSEAAAGTVMDLREKRERLARVARVNILQIDPENPDDPNADLIRKIKIREGTDADGNATKLIEFEVHDALKAIQIDNDLDGSNPEANATEALATALRALASPSPIPTDTM